MKNTIIHVYVYLVAYLYSTHILSFYRAKKLFYGLTLFIHDCIGCLFIYTLVYYTHYSFFYKVKYRRPVNLQFNSWHVWLLIKHVTLDFFTQILFNNYLYKLRYLFILFINCCLYLQLTLFWSNCLEKLETRSLWVAFRRVFLVWCVHTVFSITTQFMFSFILSNPMSQDIFLLIVVVCLFIMNKSRAINRFELLDGPSVIKICKENYSSFRKVIEEQHFNYLLNYFIIIVVYNITISRPLFLGILELDILYLLHYRCTILFHGKRSDGNAIIK